MISWAFWALLLIAGISASDNESQDGTGTPATIEDFPSMVQVENGQGPFWVQYCVGSILTNRHILSAAHCFSGPLSEPRFRRVRAGATFRGRDGQIFNVEAAFNHPSFGEQGFDGSITVVRLASSLTFGSTIQQATVTAAGVSFPENIPVVVAGWGRTVQDAVWADRELRALELHTMNHDLCVAQYASLPIPVTVSDNMVCSGLIGGEGQNIGLRDGGAPLYFDNILVGLVAFGSPYGESYPLVSVAISPYTDWIVETAV